jgi:UDP-N-acetylmuramoyl-tripeptide--D-alanyl-D-alanine ligase
MEQLKNSSMVFDILFPFGDFLYILQQEEYDSRRYIKWLGRFFFRRNFQKRDRLKYTARAKITLSFIIVLWAAALITLFFILTADILGFLFLTMLWIIAIPIFVLMGNFLLSPFFAVAKRAVIRKASEKVSQNDRLKIIAVAGSFGKTTTKNFVYELIRYNYQTQLVPGNINTTPGIANWVIGHLAARTEILIVEMDTYKKGEIRESCLITPPDIAIITSIGDQHLERFSRVENLAAALNEVFLHSKPSARLLCDANTAKLLPSSQKRDHIIVGINDLAFLKTHPRIMARFSSSNLANLAFAVKVAKLLGISDEFVIDACEKLTPPDRRQELTTFHGYDCVDDSYNISFTTAQAGIVFAKDMAALREKQLLVVTAGIPELGPDDLDKNEALGKILSVKADHVALLKSIFHKDIKKGISDPEKYTLFKDLKEFFQRSNEQFPPKDWLLLLQPELTDLYY